VSIPHEEAQKLAQDATIELWRLDLSAWGEDKVCFTRHVRPDGGPIAFGGEVYAPVPVTAEGFSWSGGAQAEPTLSVPRNSVALVSLLKTYDNLRGALVERIRTKRRHLDDGEDPDPGVHWPIEVWAVDQVKKPASGEKIEIVLASPVDQAAVQLPGRIITRDYCPFPYRLWDPATGTFDYAHVFCPYAGEAYFDERGQPTVDPARDRCGKQLRDCELRFASAGAIPFGGFPGVARVRA
jgi:lambda family phage minor tail protein L